MSEDPILETFNGGWRGIDDWYDNALVDLEVEIGKVGKEREEFEVVVELDRVGEHCSNVIRTESSGAPICSIGFAQGLGRNIKGDNPEGPTEGATLVDARPLEEQEYKLRGDTQVDHR